MESAAERKTVRVTIFNQNYSLAAAGDPSEVEALAHSVDELMTRIAQRAGNMDVNRIAVLACLHMADQLQSIERQLAEHKERVNQKTRQFSLLLDQAIE
jgi:cell division protein ZapA